jgi:hypothetical protein
MYSLFAPFKQHAEWQVLYTPLQYNTLIILLLLLSLQIKGLSFKMDIFLVGFPTVYYGVLGYKIGTCSYPFYQFTSPTHWIVNEKIGQEIVAWRIYFF